MYVHDAKCTWLWGSELMYHRDCVIISTTKKGDWMRKGEGFSSISCLLFLHSSEETVPKFCEARARDQVH